jgi:hypothetical protein
MMEGRDGDNAIELLRSELSRENIGHLKVDICVLLRTLSGQRDHLRREIKRENMIGLSRQEAGKCPGAAAYFQRIPTMRRHLSQKKAMVMVIVIPTLTGKQGEPVKNFPDGSHINCFCHSFFIYVGVPIYRRVQRSDSRL